MGEVKGLRGMYWLGHLIWSRGCGVPECEKCLDFGSSFFVALDCAAAVAFSTTL